MSKELWSRGLLLVARVMLSLKYMRMVSPMYRTICLTTK